MKRATTDFRLKLPPLQMQFKSSEEFGNLTTKTYS